MRKEISVEVDEGRTEKVTLKTMKYREYQVLVSLVSPKKIQTGQLNSEVDMTSIHEYNEKMVVNSIESPLTLKTRDAVVGLPKTSFEQLLQAAQEVNGIDTKTAEATEKK